MVSENKPNNLQTNKQTAFPSVKKSSGLFLVTPVLDPSLITAQPFLPSVVLCFPLCDIIQIVRGGRQAGSVRVSGPVVPPTNPDIKLRIFPGQNICQNVRQSRRDSLG